MQWRQHCHWTARQMHRFIPTIQTSRLPEQPLTMRNIWVCQLTAVLSPANTQTSTSIAANQVIWLLISPLNCSKAKTCWLLLLQIAKTTPRPRTSQFTTNQRKHWQHQLWRQVPLNQPKRWLWRQTLPQRAKRFSIVLMVARHIRMFRQPVSRSRQMAPSSLSRLIYTVMNHQPSTMLSPISRPMILHNCRQLSRHWLIWLLPPKR